MSSFRHLTVSAFALSAVIVFSLPANASPVVMMCSQLVDKAI